MRWVSLFFLLCGVTALGYDAWEYVAGEDEVLVRLNEIWRGLNASSLDFLERVAHRYVLPEIWSDVIRPVLRAPAILIFFVLSLLFALPGMLGGRTRG